MAKNPTQEPAPSDAYQRLTERVGTAYSSARDKAGEAAQGTVTGIETNPVAALLGGLALGAIAGAMLPRSDRERTLLDPLGGRIGDAARAAVDAARTSGGDALATAGLGPDGLRAHGNKLLEEAAKAAGAATTAAVEAARSPAKAR